MAKKKGKVKPRLVKKDKEREGRIKEKALDLVEQVNRQIAEAREKVALAMFEKGLSPEEFIICDNMLDIVDGKTLEYKCWASARNVIDVNGE